MERTVTRSSGVKSALLVAAVTGCGVDETATMPVEGGGTMVLNLAGDWKKNATLNRAHAEQGWQISAVRTWEELVEFAKVFSRMKYAEG